MICPHCAESGLYANGDGDLHCLKCGWSPTVTVCHKCKCLAGRCEGHFTGGTETRTRAMVPCAQCTPEEAVG